MQPESLNKEEHSTLLKDTIRSISWNINANHQFESNWHPFSPIRNIRQLLPLAKNAFRIARRQAEITMNNFGSDNEKQAIMLSSYFKQKNGVPLGGIGSGSIGRGFAGEFMNMKIVPGQRHQRTMHGCMFIVTVRSKSKLIFQYALTRQPSQTSSLNLQFFVYIPLSLVDYYGLYPRSWTVYNLEVIDLICMQCSPVIANNYKDSCLPGSYFIWYVKNKCKEDIEVSITFCWRSGITSHVEMESYISSRDRCKGIIVNETLNDTPIQFGIASQPIDSPLDVTLRENICLESLQDTAKLWQDLSENGCLSARKESQMLKGNCLAVCNRIKLQRGEEKQVKFSLGWHTPEVKFDKTDKSYKRYYTKYFDSQDTLKQILAYLLRNSDKWNREIDEWQNFIMVDQDLSPKIKWCMLNELYYLTDGGTVWLSTDSPDDPEHQHKWGKFLMLEGFDYLMYNTYDVFYYASIALLIHWPNIQLSVQYDFANLILKEDNRIRKFLFSKRNHSKLSGRIPHDVGGPDGRPWTYLNAFDHVDSNEWKDLNLKFILTVFRDYVYTGDKQYLMYMYERIQPLINMMKAQDRNLDGLIDNEGNDQTYDAWKMFGCSAYCGGLQLAALQCMKWICHELHSSDEDMYGKWLEKACVSYDNALWNGEYYKFDSKSDILMADQLAGYWSIKQCRLPLEAPLNKIWSPERVHSILSCLYQRNRLVFMGGQCGIVNGVKKGKAGNWLIDSTSIQAGECWVGVTYALASIMLSEGMHSEATQMLDSFIDKIWNRIGLGFQTPEAINNHQSFRGASYMRALSIWSIPVLLGRLTNHMARLRKSTRGLSF